MKLKNIQCHAERLVTFLSHINFVLETFSWFDPQNKQYTWALKKKQTKACLGAS